MSSLRQRFINRFRKLDIAYLPDADGSVRVPAKHPSVGDLLITFDRSEITVFIGEITHSHFTPGACGDFNSSDPEMEAVTCAAEFIAEVVEDKWVLWMNPAGIGGSYRKDLPIDTPTAAASIYVWFGPIEREGAA